MEPTQPKSVSKLPVIISVIALVISLVSVFFLFSRQGTTADDSGLTLKQVNDKVTKLDKSIPPMIEVGLSAGYILKFDNGVTVYDTGDTGLDINYNMIAEFYHPDIMITSNSKVYQLGPTEVAWLATKINPEYILPSHHGSFPFYPKDAKQLSAEVAKQKEAGKTRAQVIDTQIGKTFEVKGLKFTWLGHSGYVIESAKGTRIAIDPEWNAVNVKYPAAYKDPNQSGSYDAILLSHGHYDHYDLKAIEKLMQPGAEKRTPTLMGIFELIAYTKQAIPNAAEHMAPINFGVWVNKQDIKDAYSINMTHMDDVSLAAVWASHSSGVTR